MKDALKDVGVSLAHGLRAPLVRWRLVLVLWLSRLLPIVVVLGLPLYQSIGQSVGRHPDAGHLLEPEADSTGFFFAWTSDFFRDTMPDVPDRLFWLVVVAWFAVVFFAGGIVGRLVRLSEAAPVSDAEYLPEHENDPGFMMDCGRYFGRFLRLAVLLVVLAHVIDYGLNGILAESQAKRAMVHHTQDFVIQKTLARGLLSLVGVWLLGLIAAYTQIHMVISDRASAVLSFLRAVRIVLRRLLSVLLVESGMLALAGLAALAAWLLPRAVRPDAGSTGLGIGLFVVVAAVVSYLRSGVEVGAMEARVRLVGSGERLEMEQLEEQPEELAPPDDPEQLAG